MTDYTRPGMGEGFPDHQRFPLARPEDTMPYTWWLKGDDPAVDLINKESGSDALEDFKKNLGIAPFQNKEGEDTVFACRFEFPKYGEGFHFSDAVEGQDAFGFVDFLGGIPIECVEMLMLVCQDDKEGFDVKEGKGVAAPVPGQFFKGVPEDRIILNYLYLAKRDVAKIFAHGLAGEPDPKLHWWVRFRFLKNVESPKFPTPGKFMGMGVRMMPDEPWGVGAGKQKSSPFIFSGNWADTVFYSGAKIKSIEEPTDERPFELYTVTWRGQEHKVFPSDFNKYEVGDTVTILKDVAADKDSQLWKDDDMKNFGDNWQIAPICFYEKKEEE
jgi:hypothetical protein